MTETFILKEDVLPAEVLLEAAKKALYKEMNEGLTNVAECQVIFKDQNENPLHTFKLRFTNKHRDSVVIYESQQAGKKDIYYTEKEWTDKQSR